MSLPLDPAAPIRPGTPAYRRLSIAMLMAGFSTFSLLYGVQPLLPFLASHFAISPANASLAVSVTTASMAICILLAGVVSDRVGRRPMMVVSLFAAGAFGTLAAFSPSWHALLALRLMSGIALAGVPAVAMAYVGEEVESASIGAMMGLYIGGSAMGGLLGRVGVALITDLLDWRAGLGIMGAASLVAAAAFWAAAPASRAFTSRRHSLGSVARGVRDLLTDRAQRLLHLEGFLLMGAFVTLYNYVGFRLNAAPYSLPASATGAIFLLYLLGSVSSAWTGRLAGKLGMRVVFWRPIVLLLAGVLITALQPLVAIIVGLGVITVGFFGAHTVASSWVSRRAFDNRAQASALYLFFYYLGSSVLGSTGGLAWSLAGWSGVTVFTGALCALALAVARILAKITPLADPRQPAPSVTDTAGAA